MTLFDGVYIHPESYGTVLVIGAWNFPLLLTLAPVLPAIAAGINVSLDRFDFRLAALSCRFQSLKNT